MEETRDTRSDFAVIKTSVNRRRFCFNKVSLFTAAVFRILHSGPHVLSSGPLDERREIGTGIKGERYKKLLLHIESRGGTARPPTSIARHAPLRMHRSPLRAYVSFRTLHAQFGVRSVLWQKAKMSILCRENRKSDKTLTFFKYEM